MKSKQALLLALLTLCSPPLTLPAAHAQGTVFTYQGQLNAGGAPANGSFDFTFALFNNNGTNSGQVGATLTNLDVAVNNGLFTVQLDFGAVFAGNATWLAVGVRSNGGGGGFTVLNPLQELTPTPYAIYASNAGLAAGANSVAATNIIGTIPLAQLPAVPASNITGTIALGQLPAVVLTNGATGVTLSGNITNTAPLPVQRGVSSFVIGLQTLGQWTNLIEAGWFSPGQNYVSPTASNGACNLTGIVTNNGTGSVGIASLTNMNGFVTGGYQTNSGIYLTGTNSCILFSNLPYYNPPFTILIFFTQAGWRQPQFTPGTSNLAYYFQGGFCATTNLDGNYPELVSCISYGGPIFTAYSPVSGGGSSTISVINAPTWSSSECAPHCVAMSCNGTNLNVAVWSGFFQPFPAWTTNATTIAANNCTAMNAIRLGSAPGGTSCMVGVIHGFIALNAFLTQTQVQQLFALAANTVLPWRRVLFEGDSLANNLYLDSSVCPDYQFWGNCAYNSTAVGGTTMSQIVNRFYDATATNMPNGLDIIYPATVLFWGGQNSLSGGMLAASIASDLQWEVNAVHACGSRIYLSTPTESASVTGAINSPGLEQQRMALKAWELAGASGADGVVDNDTMFFNLFGTNYYTNLSYFDGSVHPNAAGNAYVATNFAGVIGASLLTPNNLTVSWPLQPILNSVAP